MTRPEPTRGRLAALREEDREIWSVSDDESVVRLSVGVDGTLETLHLSPQWWQKLSAEELGALVMQLIRASAASRNQSIADLEDAEIPDHAADETAMISDSPTQHSRTELTARLQNLLTAFSEVDDYRQAVEAATRDSARLRSPSGNVSLEVVGGAPRSLVIDPYNVQLTSEHALASEIVALFQEASRWLGDRRERVLEELPELAAVLASVRM
ncbi:hypothetical protein ACIPV2_07720 [Microbacterium sp. NPDC089987]|uniref:hypothetical protein n=1 Tax=Microbacterium sp. NPDC089987 TaxID=3364202 RepID=UPI00382031E8